MAFSSAAAKECYSCNVSSENVNSLKKKKTEWECWSQHSEVWGDARLRKEMSSGGFASSAPSPGLKEVNTQQTKMHTHTYCGNKSQHMQNFSSFVAHISFINFRLSLISIWITNNERPAHWDFKKAVLFLFLGTLQLWTPGHFNTHKVMVSCLIVHPGTEQRYRNFLVLPFLSLVALEI